MLLLGSGWKKSVGEVTSYPSSQFQSEVACGLVLSGESDATILEGWDDKKLIEDTLIAGEFCKVNGQEINPYERMPEIPDLVTIENFQVDDSFRKLKEFLAQFNEFAKQSKAMKELGLKPIVVMDKEYKEVSIELIRHLLNFKGKKAANLLVEPPFILALKKLLQVLCKRWAKS